LNELRSPFDFPQHRIAQRLQFRILDPVEFDPKLEDRDRNQLCRVAIAVHDEGRVALFEGCQHRSQIFFKIRHSVFPLPSQRDDRCGRGNGWINTTHPKKSDGIRTEKIDFVVTQICDIARQSPYDSAAMAARWPSLSLVHREKNLERGLGASGSARPVGGRFQAQTVS
ncbi:MAG: hypothetical protein WBE54_04805, partial [Bradyrhizobium sp.]